MQSLTPSLLAGLRGVSEEHKADDATYGVPHGVSSVNSLPSVSRESALQRAPDDQSLRVGNNLIQVGAAEYDLRFPSFFRQLTLRTAVCNPLSPCLKMHRLHGEIWVSAIMVIGGSLTSFFGSALYVLSPDTASGTGLSTLKYNIWLTFLMTMSVFVCNVVFCSFSPENIRALQARATPGFFALVCVPSAADAFITGAQTIALSLVAPALVGILKTSVQLVSIAVTSRLFLNKPQAWAAWMALTAVLVGVAIVVMVDVIYGGRNQDDQTEQIAGLAIVAAAGLVGGWRNLIEAAILSDDDLPSGALLMAESLLSALVLMPFSALIAATDYGVSTSHLRSTLLRPAGIPFLILFVCTAYAKDSGKFWLIKHASPLRQKILALLFPFGTWLLSLLVYYCHEPLFGVPWRMPSSLLQLLGFTIILFSNVCFLLAKSGQLATYVSFYSPPRERGV